MIATVSLLASASLVTPPPRLTRPAVAIEPALGRFDPLGLEGAGRDAIFEQEHSAATLKAMGLAAILAAQPEAAMAKGGAYGIWEGRIVSLAHPTVMALVYATSAFAAFSGWQWRRLRELGGEITALKAELKGPKAKLDALGEGESPPAALATQVKELEAQVEALTATRKELAGGDFRDKHYQAGALVLGLGTSFAIEGPINTFLRAQKLFPGPHLYAGAGVVVCWAMAASLVPQMQNGKDAARYGHMAFNALALGLFTWQIPTGWEITQKVVQFTKFP